LAEMHQADLRPFDLAVASRTEYDPTHFQPVLFCADSFELMYQTLREYLLKW
jgi:phenylalanine-4-hydroxylase